MAGFSFFLPAFARWGATRGTKASTPFPLRGCPRARALEWESWISLRRLLGDSNAVASLCWGLGGVRHFRGALRPLGTVLEVCLRVRPSDAIRVLGALVRMILDLWAAPPRCGYLGELGIFFVLLRFLGVGGLFISSEIRSKKIFYKIFSPPKILLQDSLACFWFGSVWGGILGGIARVGLRGISLPRECSPGPP